MKDVVPTSFGLLTLALFSGPALAGDPPPKSDTVVWTTLDDEEEEDLTLREALAGGRTWLSFRYRFENVDQGGFDKDANASTLRTVLGYETASYRGFRALLEAEDVSEVITDDYSAVPPPGDRPVIGDPDGTEINQAYLAYDGWEGADVRAGRQKITLDNLRFIGNVGWRQNEQTYDAYSVTAEAPGEIDVFYGFIENVNRVFGDDFPAGDADMNSHLLNLRRVFEDLCTVVLFVYDLDYEDAAALSTTTIGGAVNGTFDLEHVDLVWRLDYANQTDGGDNPNDVDAGYYRAELGGEFEPVTVKVGLEVLEGSGDPGDAFQTPLATLHAFNGWADLFLATPPTGLEDAYISVGGTWHGTKLLAVFHDFSSESESMDYGTELDLLASRQVLEDVTVGVKYADYDADDFATDTTKFWVWASWGF